MLRSNSGEFNVPGWLQSQFVRLRNNNIEKEQKSEADEP
jgi:hypothetical protein